MRAAEAEQAQGEEEFPYWLRNKWALSCGSLFLALGFGLVVPFLPLMLRELGVETQLETWVGVASGGYFAISFMMTPFWGTVADHYGRRLMVLRTSLGMAFVFLLLSFSGNPWTFCGIYMLMGFTNGYNPASQALISTNTPHKRIGESLALLLSGGSVGATLGPVLAALLVGILPGYLNLFTVSSAMLMCTGGLSLLLVREHFQRPQTPFRLNIAENLRIISRIPNLKVLFFCQFLYTLNYYGVVPVISLFVIELLAAVGIHAGARLNLWVGLIPFVFSIVTIISAMLWGRLLGRFHPGVVLLLALLASGLLGLPTVFAQDVGQLLIARALAGLASVGLGPAAVMLIRLHAPKGMESRVLSYGAAFGGLGIGAGPFLAGLIAPALGLRPFFGLNAFALLVTAWLWLATLRKGRGMLANSPLMRT